MNERPSPNGRANGRPDGAAARAHTVFWIVVGCVLITAAALFFVWQRYQFVRLGFEVGELRQRHAALERRLEPLEVEVEYLSRPERIELLARERLGMDVPQPEQVIVIEPPEAGR